MSTVKSSVVLSRSVVLGNIASIDKVPDGGPSDKVDVLILFYKA